MRNFINTITIRSVIGIRLDRTNVVKGDKASATSPTRYLSVRHVPNVVVVPVVAVRERLDLAASAAALHLVHLCAWMLGMPQACWQPVPCSKQSSTVALLNPSL